MSTALENCSDAKTPDISTLLNHMSTPQQIGVCFEGFAVFLIVLLFFNDWLYFWKLLEDSPKLKSVLIIQLTFVVYATSSFLAIISPRSSTLTELVFTVYFSFTLKELLTLMLYYLGGEHHAIGNTGGLQANLAVTPFACFCGRCCPHVYINKRFLLFIKIAVYQTAVIHPILDFFSAMLWTNQIYENGDVSPYDAAFYFLLLEKLSILLAFYALTVLFWSARDELNRHHIAGKFVCIQITMVVSGFQETVLNFLVKFGIITCSGILNAVDRSTALHHYIVVPEMLILYVLSCYFYRLEEKLIIEPTQRPREPSETEPLLTSEDGGYGSLVQSAESDHVGVGVQSD